MHITLHAEIAAEQNQFSLDGVTREIDEKLVRRTPTFSATKPQAPVTTFSKSGNRSKRRKKRARCRQTFRRHSVRTLRATLRARHRKKGDARSPRRNSRAEFRCARNRQMPLRHRPYCRREENRARRRIARLHCANQKRGRQRGRLNG